MAPTWLAQSLLINDAKEYFQKLPKTAYRTVVLVLLCLNAYYWQEFIKKTQIKPSKPLCDDWFRGDENSILRICYDSLGRCERLDIAFDRSGFFISIPYNVLRKTRINIPDEKELKIEFELLASLYNRTIITRTGKITKKTLFDDSLANCPDFSKLELIEFVFSSNFT